MGCGCKKKKTEEVNQIAQIVEVIQNDAQEQPTVNLTENQEKLVDAIVERLSKMDPNS